MSTIAAVYPRFSARAHATAILVVGFVSAAASFGQATSRAVFVANNGNLEGSVTAFTVDPNGALVIVNRIVTGTRPTISDPCPGCNPYEISLTPNGRYLATGHATGPDPLEQVTIFAVAANASISQVGAFLVPGTPMDVAWITDEYLAVTRTDPNPNQVMIYRFNPALPSLTQVDAKNVGGFSAYLAVHPNHQYLYVDNSGTGTADLYAFSVAPTGALTQIDTENTGSAYVLEVAVSHDGTKLYAAGGITYVIPGFNVAGDGTLSPMAGSPFPQFGTSPSNVAFSSDDRFLLVGHGTDATVRTASINQTTGALTYTGNSFTVGIQGTLGDVQSLDDLFFVTHNSTPYGVYDFTLHSDGSFVQNGALVSTGGIAPRSMATWKPAAPPLCAGDTNCDGRITFADIDPFVEALSGESAWAHSPCPWRSADCNHDGSVTFADIDPFVALIGTTCP